MILNGKLKLKWKFCVLKENQQMVSEKMIWKMDGNQLARLEILNGAPLILIKLILGGAGVIQFIQAGFQMKHDL